MPKFNITNNDPMRMADEINSWHDPRNGTVLRYFLAGKINEFQKHNGIRVRTCIERLNETDREFCEYTEEDGKITYKIEKVDGKDRRVIKEGKTEEEFNKAYHKILSEIVAVEI